MSKACCSIPPVQSDYTPRGEYKYINGMKTYVVGSQTSKKVITVIYDIFGFHNSTLQGADILADQGYLVVVPDFFAGKPMALENFPPDNKEKEKIVGDFFNGPADVPTNLKVLGAFATAASKEFPEVSSHAILGYCWGGKVAIKAAEKRDVFKAVAVVHPAFVDAADAPALSAPIIMLASKDEPAEDVKAFEQNLSDEIKSKSLFKTFSTMHHGWAAARADLKDKANLEKYKEAYEDLANFFQKNVV